MNLNFCGSVSGDFMMGWEGDKKERVVGVLLEIDSRVLSFRKSVFLCCGHFVII